MALQITSKLSVFPLPKIKIDQARSTKTDILVVRDSAMVFNTFNNISVASWRSVLLVEETGVPR
jgi:hypothetical protein